MGYRTKTFTANEGKATITVREEIGLDLVDSQVVYGKLSYSRASDREKNRAVNFARAVTHSTVEGDLGFAWADLDADAKAMQTAFEGWQALTSADFSAWQVALNEVNTLPLVLTPPTKKAAEGLSKS